MRNRPQDARKSLVIMNSIFIVIALGCAAFTIYQEKRRLKLVEAEKNMKKSEELAKRAQELMVPMFEGDFYSNVAEWCKNAV